MTETKLREVIDAFNVSVLSKLTVFAASDVRLFVVKVMLGVAVDDVR